MRLAVNIDHIATIREARQAREPEPVAAAILAELAGAQGITVHLRGDRRHIKERDVELLRQVVSTKLNIEMAATAEMIGDRAPHPARPGDARAGAPARADHAGRPRRGRRTARRSRRRGGAAARPASASASSSIRIPAQVEASKEVGADAIEINTGGYADASPSRPAGASGARRARRPRRAAGAGPRGAGRPRPHLRQRPPDRRAPRDRGAQHRPQHRRARGARRPRAGGARDGGAAGVAAVRRALRFAALFVIVASGVMAATPQEVSFRTDDGVMIAGALYLPGRPGPGIILRPRPRPDARGLGARGLAPGRRGLRRAGDRPSRARRVGTASGRAPPSTI